MIWREVESPFGGWIPQSARTIRSSGRYSARAKEAREELYTFGGIIDLLFG